MSLDITGTDMFCGAGGSTTGAVRAGVSVQLAINHWPVAIETHNTNYPKTTHVLTDISRADPWRFPRTTILLASPECTNHSLSKGRKRRGLGQAALPSFGESGYDPAEERSRCTMWDPLRWAECHGYELVMLENVVDARLWVMWDAWLHAWQSLGYEFEIVYLNSMFAHPTPQSRDRMYFVAWRRGNRKPDLQIRPKAFCPRCEQNIESVQSWKNPTRRHGKYRQQYVYCCPMCATVVTPYYYAAAHAIDWTQPITRIGDRKTPLKEKTLRRIAYGLAKFSRQPFTVQVNKTSDRIRATMSEPMPTQTGDNGLALVEQERLDHIAEDRPRNLAGPISTVAGEGNHQRLVIPPAWLMTYYNTGQLVPVEQAAPTVTTLERHALVTASTETEIRVEDCGFRMLEWQEIRAAMAFPDDYVIIGNRREKVKQLGNAVTPPVMERLVERAVASLA